MRPIADTGLLVGFLDASDQYHEWAKGCLAGLHSALITCEAVMAETEYLVPGSGPLLMAMVGRGTLDLRSMLPTEAESLAALMKRYGRMQFADACVVRLSEMVKDAVVFTTDRRDFAIYRRHRNQRIETRTP